MARTALLILDMFNLFDFPQGQSLARAALRITPAVKALRDRFDRAGAPVVHVNDNFAHWQGEFHDLRERCADAGGAPAKIAAQLAPRSGHYFVLKPKHSGFLCCALPVLLAQLRIRRLVLAGISTDACVLATAQDANMRGYPIWVPEDCVATRTAAGQRRALALMSDTMDIATAPGSTIRGLFPTGP